MKICNERTVLRRPEKVHLLRFKILCYLLRLHILHMRVWNQDSSRNKNNDIQGQRLDGKQTPTTKSIK